MTTLTEAIRAAYQRQSELIKKQNSDRQAVIAAMQSKYVPTYLYSVISDAIYKYYQRELEDINTTLIALEGVRDATD